MFLFAAEAFESTAWLEIIFRSPYTIGIVLFSVGGLIALTAIITGTILSWRKQSMKHRERLAMIEQGMHPDGSGGKDEAPASDQAPAYRRVR